MIFPPPRSQFQAKRKKHAKDNDETTANRHAAQIFAEMLGQVCHPDFYEDLENHFQEVKPTRAPCQILLAPVANTLIGICGSHPSHEDLSLLCQISKHLSHAYHNARCTIFPTFSLS